MSETKYKLTYFDIPGGRAETTRLAFTLGGIDFEDRRVPFSEWPKVREEAPFNACPFLEFEDRIVGQSNAIARYVGRLVGLYPEDPLQALLCDELLDAVEEMWMRIGPTMMIKDPEELKKAREEMANGPYTRFLQQFEQRLERAGGEYFCDGRLTLADLQVLTICRALCSGNFDHIPVDLVSKVAPGVASHMQRMLESPAVKEYYARYQ